MVACFPQPYAKHPGYGAWQKDKWWCSENFVSPVSDKGTRLTLDQAQRLWKGEVVPEANPGAYRRIQNYVANSKIGEVIYTPPSAVEIPIMMSEMIKWLNSDIEIYPVLISGIAQFQLDRSPRTLQASTA